MMTLTILNPMAVLSADTNALGAIKTELAQRPKIQPKEISCEDLLLITRTINGMSHKGRITAAQKPIVFTTYPLCKGKEFD